MPTCTPTSPSPKSRKSCQIPKVECTRTIRIILRRQRTKTTVLVVNAQDSILKETRSRKALLLRGPKSQIPTNSTWKVVRKHVHRLMTGQLATMLSPRKDQAFNKMTRTHILTSFWTVMAMRWRSRRMATAVSPKTSLLRALLSNHRR